MDLAGRKSQKSKRYGICIRHQDGTIGWLTGADSSVLSFPTPDEAMKALKRQVRDAHYSWSCEIAVGEVPQNFK